MRQSDRAREERGRRFRSFGCATRCGNRCSLAAASRIWKSSSSPNRCLLEYDGESHEARFKRLRRRSGNSATVHLRWRKPFATFAMVRRAQRNAECCPALRRSRCARRHMAPLGGLRYSASPNGGCGRCRAEHQTEAGGQRFSESRPTCWRMSTSWPWASSLSLPAACPLDGPSSGKGRCVLPLTLSGRHASTRSRKRSLSVGTRDSAGRTPGKVHKERRR